MSRAARQGFTLLELLVAAVLTSVLMAGVWSMMSTYGRLFEKGQAKVEQSQLVRALVEQFSDDLRSAIPDTATGLPGASSSMRRFGLFGTSRSLQVDVLQVVPSQVTGMRAGGESNSLANRPSSTPSLQVPELHTIQYWVATATGEGPAAGTLQGLVRRELDWETPVAGKSEDVSLSLGATAEEGDPTAAAFPEVNPQDPSILSVPEVTNVAFRYYDGKGWSSQWNSLEKKSLPVAVEVVLTVKKPEEKVRTKAAARTEEQELSDPLLDEMGLEQGPTESHRFLVCLPATALEPSRPESSEDPLSWLMEPEWTPPALEETPPPVVEPPPPPLLTPKDLELPEEKPKREPTDLLFPDQWMRRGR